MILPSLVGVFSVCGSRTCLPCVMITLLIHMSCSILYCIVYRMNVYVWMSIFLFIHFAFLHVYTVCSIIVCFGMFILYSMYSPKEEIKNIYLQKRIPDTVSR